MRKMGNENINFLSGTFLNKFYCIYIYIRRKTNFFFSFSLQREKKRAHLNELLLRLLSKMPCKQTVDLSYLLEGGLGKRIRRKTNLSMS